MATHAEMVGRTFGRWLVLSKATSPKYKDGASWHCRCACGTEKIVSGHNMRSGATKSCGCYNREAASARMKGVVPRNIKPGDTGSRNALLCRHRHVARKRGLAFTLTDEEAFALYRGDCVYCGAPPAQRNVGYPSARTLPFIYNGLDRVDSAIGYIPGNVVSCCGHCNQAKSDTPFDEFISWIERVYRHLHTTPNLDS